MGTPLSGVAAEQYPRVARFYTPETWIEGRSEDQLDHVAGWPGIARVAAFPDLHPGRHGPVGAAFLADRLYPQLVGPDIGCGMALFRLSLPRRRLKLDKAVRRLSALDEPMPAGAAEEALGAADLAGISGTGLGTIGGGNHFCEVQEVVAAEDADLATGDLCLLVHSGSRALGAGIFARLAARWAEGFAEDSPAGRDYLELHDSAVRWAALNRRMIALRAAEALGADLEPICDAPHNLVTRAGGGWLHRKGAAAPEAGRAPLAGSRDDLSFLLAAAPGAEALWSLSHGAGRRYDRSAMHGRIRKHRSGLDAMTRNRFGGQIVCADRDLLIEEAGSAYKPVTRVAEDLEAFGLARRAATLAPLLTWKTGARR